MKKNILILFCLCSSFFTYADTEPNNDSPGGADVIAQNGSVSGTITAGNYDFYELNTTGDGNITVTLDAATSSYMYVHLYDSAGTQILATVVANAGGGPVSFTVYQLGAGKYYVTTQGNGADSYTVSNSVDLLATPNDAEPNNTFATAIPIFADDSTRGHITYRNPNGTYDSNDYYKLTTSVDGNITVTITNSNGTNININLYDSIGQQNIAAVSGTGGGSFTGFALAAGTYYIRVSSNLTGEYSGYNLSYHLTPTAYVNDIEPNDLTSNASILNVNDSTTGHIMHRWPGGSYDLIDWYQLVTTAEGNLTISIYNSTNSYIGLTLYDSSAVGWINSVGGPGQSGINMVNNNLPAGTYYVKVYANLTTEFSGYTLSNNFITTGINELTSISKFEVYPNPTTDVLSVRFLDANFGEKKIIISDMSDRICYSMNVLTKVGENVMPIAIDDLAKGIYIVSLSSDSATKQILFIKN